MQRLGEVCSFLWRLLQSWVADCTARAIGPWQTCGTGSLNKPLPGTLGSCLCCTCWSSFYPKTDGWKIQALRLRASRALPSHTSAQAAELRWGLFSLGPSRSHPRAGPVPKGQSWSRPLSADRLLVQTDFIIRQSRLLPEACTNSWLARV